MKKIVYENPVMAIIGATVLTAFLSQIIQLSVTKLFDAPQTQAAAVGAVNERVNGIDTKISNVEIVQKTQASEQINQKNKIDWLVGAVYKFSERLQTNVPPPPIDQ